MAVFITDPDIGGVPARDYPSVYDAIVGEAGDQLGGSLEIEMRSTAGSADTNRVEITGVSNYSNIQLRASAGQRHSGTWDQLLPRFEVSAAWNYVIRVSLPSVVIDGIQVQQQADNGAGIQVISATSGDEITIKNNLVRYGGGLSTSTVSVGLDVGNGNDVSQYTHFYNNVVYGGWGYGQKGDVGLTDFSRNTFHNCNWGMSIGYTTEQSLYRCNMSTHSRLEDYDRGYSGIASGFNNISSDTTSPDGVLYQNAAITYTDPVNGDFSLAASDTDAIDRGVAIGGITEDIIGTTLPQGSAPDIGAFEYIAAGLTVSSDGVLGISSRTISSSGSMKNILNTSGLESSLVPGIATKSELSFLINSPINSKEVVSSLVNVVGFVVSEIFSDQDNTAAHKLSVTRKFDSLLEMKESIETSSTSNTTYKNSLSVSDILPVLFSGGLGVEAINTSKVSYNNSVVSLLETTVSNLEGIYTKLPVKIEIKANVVISSDLLVNAKQSLAILYATPLIYLGSLGIFADSDFVISFKNISHRILALSNNFKLLVERGANYDVQYKEFVAEVENLSYTYKRLIERLESTSLLWGGGVLTESITDLPIIFNSTVASNSGCLISNSVVVIRSEETECLFKNKTELPASVITSFLSTTLKDNTQNFNYTSVVLVDRSQAIRWSSEEDVFFVDGDVEVWTLNPRDNVWRLF